MTSPDPPKAGRPHPVTYLNVLRVVACFLVIVNHTNSRVFFATTPDAGTWYVSLGYFFFSRVAVPIFVMISGVLLLNKIDPWRKSVSRVRRVLLALVIFSIPYYLLERVQGDAPVDPLRFFVALVRAPFTNALWYLYLYLAILVLLPFLQRFNRALDARTRAAFIAVNLIATAVLPALTALHPGLAVYNPSVGYPFVTTFVSYLFLGYALHHDLPRLRGTLVVCVAVTALVIPALVLLTVREFHRHPGTLDYLLWERVEWIPIVLISSAVFLAVRQLVPPEPAGSFIRVSAFLGGLTFGIYLLSDLWIKLLYPVNPWLDARMHPMFSVLVMQAVVFALGVVVTFVLRKLPVFRGIL